VIGGTCTPKLARMVSWKYSKISALDVTRDFEENHGRSLSREFVQSLSTSVSDIAAEHEMDWSYCLPQMPYPVTHISIGRDGTTTPIVGGKYREAMNGTIALYSAKGERMHTIYTTCAPEYGKKTFDTVFDMEIGRIKAAYPNAVFVGLADGAKDNWTYLLQWVTVCILDFYHATTYLAQAAGVLHDKECEQKQWLDQACHDLRHKPNGAKFLLREMKHEMEKGTCSNSEKLQTCITYFENNHLKMKYAAYQKLKYPIGSGVTEAACKVMVKQRLCNSGMKWIIPNTERMFLLRGLILTEGRWKQFWDKAAQMRA
jgi:hypothetical protein